MAELKPIIICLLLVGLMIVALITGMVMFAQQNNATSITDDATVRNLSGDLSGTLNDNYGTTTSSQTALENSSITTTTGIPFIDAIGGMWKNLKRSSIIVYNVIITFLFVTLLGSVAGLIITTTLGSILLIVIIFAIVEWVSTGRAGRD